MPALSIDAVSHSYGTRPRLIDINFTVAPAGFTALLGLKRSRQEHVFSLVTRCSESDRSPSAFSAHDIGIAPASASAAWRRVQATHARSRPLGQAKSAFHARCTASSGARPACAAMRCSTRIGLDDRAGSKVRDLSGGQMRRLESHAPLLHRPRLLLLDEATRRLDVKARADILSHVRQLVIDQGIGVLWATHYSTR